MSRNKALTFQRDSDSKFRKPARKKPLPVQGQGHVCPICQHKFAKSFELEQHRRGILGGHSLCPKCGQTCYTDAGLSDHLASAHGLKEKKGIEIDLDEFGLRLEPIPNFKPPHMRRVPKTVEGRQNWLLPLCQKIVQSNDPKEVLRNPPPKLKKRADYVLGFLGRLERALNTVRIKRLKKPGPKALALAAALADPSRAPTYAIQKAE